MAVKIRLKRMGKIRQPHYRIIVVDSRKKRDGRVIEEVGKYHPKEDPSFIEVVSDRIQYWLGVGAQPTEAVAAILKVTGDWQKFKGLPGAEGTLKSPAAKQDKSEAFQAAVRDAANEPKADAVTKKTTKADKPEAKANPKDDVKQDDVKADEKSDAEADTQADTKADTKDEGTAEAAEAKAQEAPAEDAAEESAAAKKD